jgi:hypothetical protein
MMLTQYGLPPLLVGVGAMAAFGGLTAYIAHIIMADKVSWISNMVSGSMVSKRSTDRKTDRGADRRADRKSAQRADKKTESAASVESVASRRAEQRSELPGLEG